MEFLIEKTYVLKLSELECCNLLSALDYILENDKIIVLSNGVRVEEIRKIYDLISL